ncbi:hypothetical protein QF015_002166 [Paenarthrobacter sp. TE4293]|uniref:hypothetical protein n=1 Tax=Paenarthrobacter sp. TE4293 TaxID=3381695 RepID=UPI003D1DEF80
MTDEEMKQQREIDKETLREWDREAQARYRGEFEPEELARKAKAHDDAHERLHATAPDVEPGE